MKRFLMPSIGLVAWLAFAPAPAHALTPLCAKILTLTPIAGSGGYVDKVLKRSNAGITEAKNADLTGTFDLYIGSWADNVASTFLYLIDYQLTLNQQSLDLTQNTACLHQDFLALQCQVDKVKDEMDAAFKRGSIGQIAALQTQIPFLRERMQYLLRGANDPGFADPTWGLVLGVDPQQQNYWCCGSAGEECIESDSCAGDKFYTLDGCIRNSMCTAPAGDNGESSRVCPFTSNYAPALRSGYGCYPAKMGNGDYLSLNTERNALQKMMDAVNDEAAILASDGIATLSTFSTGSSSSSGSAGSSSSKILPPQLKEVQGCLRKYGYCSRNPYLGCSADADCETRGGGECQFDLETDVSWEGLRNSFSLDKDEIGIVTQFFSLKGQEGFSRKQPEELRTVDELYGSSASSERAEEIQSSFLDTLFENGFRSDFRDWSKMQGEAEVSPFLQAGDSVLTMIKAFPSTGIARELRDLVTKKEGIRSFLVRYSYFARRTCMNRPCSMKLEQALRLAETEACFPYASGAFRAESESDPQWVKCAEQACIPIAGADLSEANCVCYKTNMGTDLNSNPTEVGPDEDPDVCFPRP